MTTFETTGGPDPVQPVYEVAMAVVAAGVVDVVGPDGAVSADVPCRKCQYNLRGLAVDGRCPECGTPVGLSTRGDYLRYSDPAWVASLRTGVQLMLWAIVVSILGAVVGGIVARAIGSRLLPTLISSAGGLLSVAGGWLLTTPDPSGLGEDRYGTSRKVIRVTLAVGLVQQGLTFVQQTGTFPPAINLLLTLTASGAALVGLVGTFATLHYLSKLALRIPDASLAERARSLVWAYGVPLGLLVLGGVVTALLLRGGLRGGLPPGFMAFSCFAGLCGVTLAVTGIMYLFMLGKLSKRFAEQAALARATWAAG